MKITIYTTSTCSFSAAEKAYLQSRNLPFEEKNVETSKENLEELLKVGNNFAGTPVTKIEKDDGKVVILKGFTKEEIEKELPLTTPAVQAPASQTPTLDVVSPVAPETPAAPAAMPDLSMAPAPAVGEPVADVSAAPMPPVQMPDMTMPQSPVSIDPVVSQVMPNMATQPPVVTFDPAPMNVPATQEPAPMYQPQTPMAPAMPEPAMPTMSFEPPMAQAPQQTAPAMPTNNPLDSILKDLQNKVGSPDTGVSPAAPASVMPSIPDFPAK
jgi:glutaredoxin 3